VAQPAGDALGGQVAKLVEEAAQDRRI
jgi:hypothetical protein